MKSLMEEMGIGYRQVGEVQILNLVVTDTNYPIGIWGQRHKDYLLENHRLFYYNLLTTGKLNSYLHDIDVSAKEMYDRLIKQIAKQEGITEQLKADNQMLWVQQMNNIANRAREIVYNEIIYQL
ncbi:tnpV protein [Clostridium sp. CAG:678]|nr:tnpV protein [Clostridium sp. CAG:678]HIZ11298.1 TnpV protein [Candidatus Eubacterium faecavium]